MQSTAGDEMTGGRKDWAKADAELETELAVQEADVEGIYDALYDALLADAKVVAAFGVHRMERCIDVKVGPRMYRVVVSQP